MNKVVVVHKGSRALLAELPLDVVSFDYVDSLEGACSECTMNQFAAQGYMEAKNWTNNWEITRNAYYNCTSSLLV